MQHQGQAPELYHGPGIEASRGLAEVFHLDTGQRHSRGVASKPAEAGEQLAMVCHELRGPVAAMRYAIRLWNSQAPDARKQQQLQTMIERQATRMSRLIDDLLDVSRMTNGRMHLKRERLDLRRVVEHAIETVAPEVDAGGHQLTLRAPDGPAWVAGDPYRLEQVFVNLISNAAKYTDHGGQLSVHVAVPGRLAVVRVCDSGIGIAPQMLPYVFDLFRQVDDAGPRARPGLGIGLAIVRSLVELHDGNVVAASEGVGCGSEFTVSLPRAG